MLHPVLVEQVNGERKAGYHMKKPYFPLFVDLSEKKILVAGAGKIATRRVETLLEFAGYITVVAPEATGRIMQLSHEKKIRWIDDIYHESMACEADLVLAATNDAACNRRIVEECRALDIPVNICNEKGLCDFYFPGIIRREGMVMGFTSGGQDHRKVREIRERIERIFDQY